MIFELKNEEQLLGISIKIAEIYRAPADFISALIADAAIDNTTDELVTTLKTNKVYFDDYYFFIKLYEHNQSSQKKCDSSLNIENIDDLEDSVREIFKRYCSSDNLFQSIYRINFEITDFPSKNSIDDEEQFIEVMNGEYVGTDISLNKYLRSVGVLGNTQRADITEKVFSGSKEYDDDFEWLSDNETAFIFSSYCWSCSNNRAVIADCGSLYIKSKFELNQNIELDTESTFYVLDRNENLLLKVKLISCEGIDYSFYDKNNKPKDTLIHDDLYEDLETVLSTIPPMFFEDAVTYRAERKESLSLNIVIDGIDGIDGDADDMTVTYVSFCYVDEDEKEVTLFTPSYIDLCNEFDYYEAQSLTSCSATLANIYRKTGQYDDYLFRFAGKDGEDNYSSLGEDLAVVYKRNMEFVLEKKKTDISPYEHLCSSLSKITTPTQLIDALIGYGVTSVSANELINHDAGDMCANVFVAKTNDRQQEDIVFEIQSMYGYCEKYTAFRDELNKRLNGRFRVCNVLEYDWQTQFLNTYQEVLQLPESVSEFVMPYILLIFNIEDPDVRQINAINEVNQELIKALIPRNTPIPTEQMVMLPPTLLPAAGAKGLISYEIERVGLSNIGDHEKVERLTRNLKKVGFERLEEQGSGFFGCVILCDTTDSELTELMLRNMIGQYSPLRLSSEQIAQAASELKIKTGMLKQVLYADSVLR